MPRSFQPGMTRKPAVCRVEYKTCPSKPPQPHCSRDSFAWSDASPENRADCIPGSEQRTGENAALPGAQRLDKAFSAASRGNGGTFRFSVCRVPVLDGGRRAILQFRGVEHAPSAGREGHEDRTVRRFVSLAFFPLVFCVGLGVLFAATCATAAVWRRFFLVRHLRVRPRRAPAQAP